MTWKCIFTSQSDNNRAQQEPTAFHLKIMKLNNNVNAEVLEESHVHTHHAHSSCTLVERGA